MSALVVTAACQTDLDASYDDYRAEIPPVCKDYCEEKIACERASQSSTGVENDDSFSALIHQCVVLCGSYAVEGAYVWSDASASGFDRNYHSYISSDLLFKGFECLYNQGAYRCVEIQDGYVHRLNAPISSVCQASNECITDFQINLYWSWQVNADGLGGSCKQNGADNIDAIFF